MKANSFGTFLDTVGDKQGQESLEGTRRKGTVAVDPFSLLVKVSAAGSEPLETLMAQSGMDSSMFTATLVNMTQRGLITLNGEEVELTPKGKDIAEALQK